MAVTSKGIWTPDNSDQYDLVVGSAATANSIDRAISKTAVTLAGLGTGVFTGQWGWVTGGGGQAYQWTGTGWRARETDDTGWVSQALDPSLSGTFQCRRMNGMTFVKAEVSGSFAPEAPFQIGTVSTTFRPVGHSVAVAAAMQGEFSASARLSAAGALWARNTSSTPRTVIWAYGTYVVDA